jgi:hypothetical protein
VSACAWRNVYLADVVASVALLVDVFRGDLIPSRAGGKTGRVVALVFLKRIVSRCLNGDGCAGVGPAAGADGWECRTEIGSMLWMDACEMTLIALVGFYLGFIGGLSAGVGHDLLLRQRWEVAGVGAFFYQPALLLFHWKSLLT